MSYNVTLTLSRTPAGTYLPKSQLGFLLQVNILKAQPVWYNIFILPSSLRSVLQRLLSHMLLGPEHNLLRPWVFHPTVARGAVGFKSNGWQLGSAGLVKFPFAELTMWWSDWPFISIFYRHKSKLTILWQREHSPPLAGRQVECSHRYGFGLHAANIWHCLPGPTVRSRHRHRRGHGDWQQEHALHQVVSMRVQSHC